MRNPIIIKCIKTPHPELKYLPLKYRKLSSWFRKCSVKEVNETRKELLYLSRLYVPDTDKSWLEIEYDGKLPTVLAIVRSFLNSMLFILEKSSRKINTYLYFCYLNKFIFLFVPKMLNFVLTIENKVKEFREQEDMHFPFLFNVPRKIPNIFDVLPSEKVVLENKIIEKINLHEGLLR